MRSGREGAAMHCQGLNSPIRMNWQYQPLAQMTPPPPPSPRYLRSFPSAKQEHGGCSLPNLSCHPAMEGNHSRLKPSPMF